MTYLSSSKLAIAVGGNFAFAMALCLYTVLVKVRSHSQPGRCWSRLRVWRH